MSFSCRPGFGWELIGLSAATTSRVSNTSSLVTLPLSRLSRTFSRPFPHGRHLTRSLSRRNVLNFLKVQKIDLAKLTEIMTIDEVKEKLGEIVDECTKSANELQAATGFITLERGFA